MGWLTTPPVSKTSRRNLSHPHYPLHLRLGTVVIVEMGGGEEHRYRKQARGLKDERVRANELVGDVCTEAGLQYIKLGV